MKVRIKKESDSMYFAKLIWITWVYAQGETFQEAIENLMEVHSQVAEFKQNMVNVSPKLIKLVEQEAIISDLWFTQLDFAL